MNIIQITPGAGGMYCGGCFRDNALVGALRELGHSALMVPLYLPLTLDEADNSAGTPIFFSGINVYLDQKSALFRRLPRWVHRLLATRGLLSLAAGLAGKTRAEDVGALTLSMIRGEEGHQARELEELVNWLQSNAPPDVICLSNVMLAGMARRLKQALRVPVVCFLQGEDSFLDSLPEPERATAWKLLAARAADADLFLAPSHYFGDVMRRRLSLPAEKVKVVYNGINLEGYEGAASSELRVASSAAPVLGYFARMCKEKGLDTLVDTFILLRERQRVPNLKLRVGGGCGPSDEPFVNTLRERLKARGLFGDVEFCPNLDRAAKLDFYRSLTVICTPALYGEAFGLYVIEAMAAGVPVVQPRHAAFPELIEATGGGLVCDPTPAALADGLEQLLLHPERARALGQAGRKAVLAGFSIQRMAQNVVRECAAISNRKS